MKNSLRRKIILTFFIFLLVGTSIFFINYHKQHFLGRTLQCLDKEQDLFNTILEARRYEKNYFLTLKYQNLNDAIDYVNEGEQMLSDIMEDQNHSIIVNNLDERTKKLQIYKDALGALSNYYKGGYLISPEGFKEDLSRHQEDVRAAGKLITSDVEQMVKKERQYVSKLVAESRTYHLIAFVAIICLCIFTTLYLVFNVIRPLKFIEKAIDHIARGDYENIPALGTGDEFESLVTSLNHMIVELNRRSDQLAQSAKMASLGTLTSGVAHELNNPLNNISTSVQILLEELEETDYEYKKQLLSETENQVERARDIVKALLEFSRARTFSPEPVCFKELVDDTIKLIKGEIPTRVKIEVDVPDSIRAELDPRRIQQVLMNLFMNGIQSMRDGGTLHIMAREDDQGQGFYFQVKDTGDGIPLSNLARVFEPFFTTKDLGHKDVGQGSGLGLPVSKGIIEQHGGWIKPDSELGKGTTFTVFLPKP